MMRNLSILLTLAAPVQWLRRIFRRPKSPTEIVHAKLYLPDAENGYYRATRFDWSGQIASLESQGHNYFGQWFDRYDPKLHDAILGPVEEFLTNGIGLGYNDVKAGESSSRSAWARCGGRTTGRSSSSKRTTSSTTASGPSSKFPDSRGVHSGAARHRGVRLSL